jgi:hypothetical protein
MNAIKSPSKYYDLLRNLELLIKENYALLIDIILPILIMKI